MSSDSDSAKVLIAGRVQGVCFRMETQREAKRLGLTGWVRNSADGSVEACFAGERESIDRMIEWCRQGPPAARVDSLEVTWQPSENWSDFRISG